MSKLRSSPDSAEARRQQTEPNQLLAQRGRCREMNAVDAEQARGGHIRVDIVDIDGVVRIVAEALHQNLVDAWFRLYTTDLAHDQVSPDPPTNPHHIVHHSV